MTVGKRKNLPAPLVAMDAPESWDREHWDNNPDGVIDLPGEGTDPSKYNRNNVNAGRKMCFPQRIARGESPNDFGMANVVTANGTASSRGEGSNQEYNWSDGLDGAWNRNRGWGKGSNRTGE